MTFTRAEGDVGRGEIHVGKGCVWARETPPSGRWSVLLVPDAAKPGRKS